MADIFGKLNDFTLRLQGKYTTVFSVKDHATAITRKLIFWCENVKNDDFAGFPLLQNFLGDNNLTIDLSVKSDIVRHLQELQNTFLLYFPKGCSIALGFVIHLLVRLLHLLEKLWKNSSNFQAMVI